MKCVQSGFNWNEATFLSYYLTPSVTGWRGNMNNVIKQLTSFYLLLCIYLFIDVMCDTGMTDQLLCTFVYISIYRCDVWYWDDWSARGRPRGGTQPVSRTHPVCPPVHRHWSPEGHRGVSETRVSARRSTTGTHQVPRGQGGVHGMCQILFITSITLCSLCQNNLKS